VNAPQYGVNIGDPLNAALFNPASVTFNRLDILNLQNGTGAMIKRYACDGIREAKRQHQQALQVASRFNMHVKALDETLQEVYL
jgi:hypothetical protein